MTGIARPHRRDRPRGEAMGVRRALALPGVYVAFQRTVWGSALRELTTEYIRPRAGERVLDLGCGPADILRLFPPVTYTGVDNDPHYLAMARRRFGDRVEFLLGDVRSLPPFPEASFDLVLAKGIVHHLDDEGALRVFELARRALRPGGRLVTVDGCHAPDESRLARAVTDLDRGRFIRSVDDYRALAHAEFSEVRLDVRHDLLRIPYTLLVARCMR